MVKYCRIQRGIGLINCRYFWKQNTSLESEGSLPPSTNEAQKSSLDWRVFFFRIHYNVIIYTTLLEVSLGI